MENLKREIKIEVKVDNGGTITGNVKCKRVRYPENVVVSIEKVGDNIYPAPEEHGIIDQFNLVFVPHVLAVQRERRLISQIVTVCDTMSFLHLIAVNSLILERMTLAL